MFSCKFRETFKTTFLVEHFQWLLLWVLNAPLVERRYYDTLTDTSDSSNSDDYDDSFIIEFLLLNVE